jgi:hypothetical protein
VIGNAASFLGWLTTSIMAAAALALFAPGSIGIEPTNVSGSRADKIERYAEPPPLCPPRGRTSAFPLSRQT